MTTIEDATMQDEATPENIDDVPVVESDHTEAAVGNNNTENKLKDAEERVLRAQAEIENVRKRGQGELQDLLRYGEM